MIIDTHCHYNMEPLFSGQPDHFHLKSYSPLRKMDWKQHWTTAQEHGVTSSIVVGTTYETSQRALDIASNHPALYVALGIHPNHTQTASLTDRMSKGENLQEILDSQTSYLQKELARLISTNPKKVIAIGETGLDYFYLPIDPAEAELEKKIQIAYFRAHLAIAQEYNLVPILHVRDKNLSEDSESNSAYWQVLNILQQVWPSNTPFILHCISGPSRYIAQAIKMGSYTGIAGNITYKNASSLRELVSSIPHERLLLETDAPFLPPQEFRGQICQPWMVSQTAEFLQQVMNISTEKITENTRTLFAGL